MIKRLLITSILIGTLVGVFYVIRMKSQVAGIQTATPQYVQGIILPHHDMAREIIVSALGPIDRHPEVIVVFSPNHFRPRSTTFTTTPVLNNFRIEDPEVFRLENSSLPVVLDPKLLAGEHGLTTPMTYLAHAFPSARFIPIAVSPYFNPDDLDSLVNYLVENLPDNTLYVTSLDFSHENMPIQAARHNTESVTAISGFDYPTLYQFTDQNMDSPASAALLMKVMQKLGTTRWETWFDSHGALLTDSPTLQGTSYVIGVFR